MIKMFEGNNIPWTLLGTAFVGFLRNVLDVEVGPETETWIIELFLSVGSGFALNGLTGFFASVWEKLSQYLP